jgi:circadian clock protein KaiB
VSIVSRKLKFKFRLYIAGHTPNSAQVVANLNALCSTHLPDQHEIEVVDVVRDPQRALADDIRMTPTLLKISPPPARRIVGTLSQTQRVLDTLGLSIHS